MLYTGTMSDSIEDIDHYHQPFGPAAGKAKIATAGQVVHVAPYAKSPGPPGFAPTLTLQIEMTDNNLDLSIDDHTGRFLLIALLDHYLSKTVPTPR